MALNTNLVSQTLAAIASVVGDRPSPLHAPVFAGREWEYLKECLDSKYVSSVGHFVDRFEADLAAYTGAKHAVAVVNGTAALHISLLLAGVLEGDEVLLPALTFVATSNAVSYCNAIPHFIESEESSLGVNPQALREYLQRCCEIQNNQCVNKVTGRVIRALVPMHTFGHPGPLDELIALAHDFKIVLVEDAAESLGSFYRGKHTGTFGKLGALSFNGNKIITTGGGGAILTNDAGLARRAKHLTTTAKIAHVWRYDHDSVGYNYRMPNINAALGCAQLEQMPQFIETKRKLFSDYESAFVNVIGIRLHKEPVHCKSNYWLQALVLDEDHAAQHELLLHTLNDAGYMSRPVWTLMHLLEPYKSCPRMNLSSVEGLASRIINIPSGVELLDPSPKLVAQVN